MSPRIFSNFGGNHTFAPNRVYTPKNEADLVEVLRACGRDRKIRVIGRLHSWSPAAVAEDVLIDLRHMQDVTVERRDGRAWVTVGGGCQIKRLLAELDRQSAGTLPSMGLVTEQSIAGAISTGTHGSGRQSMSHFIEEVRVATFDSASGEPVIRTIRSGDDLRAARCSLGALGVIVSVSFWARPSYRIEECFRDYDDLESALRMENEFPLQQFFLMPWSWRYFAQLRRETQEPRGGLPLLYRVYFFLQFDIGLHLLVRFAVRWLRSPRFVHFMSRDIATRLVIKNWKVVDDANKMLIMEHELFQHIECEMFIPHSRLAAGMNIVVELLRYFDGDVDAFSPGTLDQLEIARQKAEIAGKCGTYTHHYPICIRRVLPDDTLISMTAGSEETYYAVSFISYARPDDRDGFFAFARVLCKVLGAACDARPHWGKVCPLSAAEAERLYPRIEAFRHICRQSDPDGKFRNEWLRQTLFAESAGRITTAH